jgi:hypothetical protein
LATRPGEEKKIPAPPIYRSSRSFSMIFDGRDLGRSSLPLDRQGPTDDDDALEASHGERSGDKVGSLRSEAKLAMMRTKIASVGVVLSPRFQRRLTARLLLRIAGGSSGLAPGRDSCNPWALFRFPARTAVFGCKQARNFGEIVQRVRHRPKRGPRPGDTNRDDHSPVLPSPAPDPAVAVLGVRRLHRKHPWFAPPG